MNLGNGLRLVAQKIKQDEAMETWKAIDGLPVADRLEVLFGIGVGTPMDRQGPQFITGKRGGLVKTQPWTAKRKRREARKRRGR